MPPKAVSKQRVVWGQVVGCSPYPGAFPGRGHGAGSRSWLSPALSHGTVSWLALSDRPQGRGMCPRAMPSALPGLAHCGIVPVVLLPFDG